jgi:hypothetical protein
VGVLGRFRFVIRGKQKDLPMQALLDTPDTTHDLQAASPNTRSWKTFAELISGTWQQQASAIIETGRHLIGAKQELSREEYGALVGLKLPFTSSTARKLMLIAENQIVCAHVHKLPPSWGTLYELTKLSDEVLRTAIKDGRINPKMQRKDVRALRGQLPDKAPVKAPATPLMASWRASSDEVKTKALDAIGLSEILRLMSIALRRDLNNKRLKEKNDPDGVLDDASRAVRLVMEKARIMVHKDTSEPVAQSHVPGIITAVCAIARKHPNSDCSRWIVSDGELNQEKRRRAAA